MAPAKYNVYKASLSWNRNEDSTAPVDDKIVILVICGLIVLSLLLCFCYTEDKLKGWRMSKSKRKLTEEEAIIESQVQEPLELPAT